MSKTVVDENIKAIKDRLYEAGYQCIGNMHGAGNSGDIEFFAGPGRVPVIAVQIYAEDHGVEVWAPLSQSNRMDDTLGALKAATKKAA